MPNLPQGCVLIDDPQDQCCQVPYCDFGPNPFPNGYPTPNPNPTQVRPPGHNSLLSLTLLIVGGEGGEGDEDNCEDHSGGDC